MGKAQPTRARKKLEVQAVFESNRISEQCLIAAYEQVLPPVRCQLHDKQQPDRSLFMPGRWKRAGGQQK
jgi:hypothetical protein